MRIVVVGTGTDVGKTHVSVCLLMAARRSGRAIAAYKPIATGVSGTCEDAERHAQALAVAAVPPTYAYRRPISPHLAAREERRAIDLEVIARTADQMARESELLLVELAGGLFTPLTETATNAALVNKLLPAFVLLVAPDRLGVLHDVGATILAARASCVNIGAVALSAPPAADEATGSNAAELDRLGLGPVAEVFPRADVDAPESQAAALQVWERILRER